MRSCAKCLKENPSRLRTCPECRWGEAREAYRIRCVADAHLALCQLSAAVSLVMAAAFVERNYGGSGWLWRGWPHDALETGEAPCVEGGDLLRAFGVPR